MGVYAAQIIVKTIKKNGLVIKRKMSPEFTGKNCDISKIPAVAQTTPRA